MRHDNNLDDLEQNSLAVNAQQRIHLFLVRISKCMMYKLNSTLIYSRKKRCHSALFTSSFNAR